MENEAGDGRATLFSRFYRAVDSAALSMNEITNNARTYIVAGSDTTSNTLTYLVWAVCRDPAVKRLLLAELAALPDTFVDADLKRLPYLSYVVEETLRLHSAAPAGLPRVVPEGGASFGKYWLPANTIVTTQAYTLHRNPVAFPNPDKFNPSRWENTTQTMKDSFMPFGGGSRGK